MENNYKDENNFIGSWELKEMNIGFIQNYIKVLCKKGEMNSGYISTNFKLTLNKDLTARIENNDGSSQLGSYFYSNDSIILRNEQYDWLVFKIETHNKHTVILNTDYATFYNIYNDSLELFTGRSVKMELKKIKLSSFSH